MSAPSAPLAVRLAMRMTHWPGRRQPDGTARRAGGGLLQLPCAQRAVAVIADPRCARADIYSLSSCSTEYEALAEVDGSVRLARGVASSGHNTLDAMQRRGAQ